MKKDESNEIHELQDVENNVLTNPKELSLLKKVCNIITMFLCLVTLT